MKELARLYRFGLGELMGMAGRAGWGFEHEVDASKGGVRR